MLCYTFRAPLSTQEYAPLINPIHRLIATYLDKHVSSDGLLALMQFLDYVNIERFSIECLKTKTKPITYQLDYSANLKP